MAHLRELRQKELEDAGVVEDDDAPWDPLGK